jgi:hypothetical protein
MNVREAYSSCDFRSLFDVSVSVVQNETPRINGKMLPQYMGRMVFLICDTSNVGQDPYGNQIVRTTDGVDVIVSLPPGEQFERYA